MRVAGYIDCFFVVSLGRWNTEAGACFDDLYDRRSLDIVFLPSCLLFLPLEGASLNESFRTSLTSKSIFPTPSFSHREWFRFLVRIFT
jgi:hypothetical protein